MAGRNDERFVAQSSAPRMCAFGALRLCYGDVEIVVAGMSGRVLTALLWRRAGLSVEQLVDVVWLNDPPKSARAALHVHLGTVRRILADTPGGAAVERSGGVYRLRLDGWEVDIDIVESLTREASGTLADDPLAAAELLDRALAIWSGQPFAVDGEPLHSSIASSFDLARLSAEESRVEALIAAGRLDRAEQFATAMTDAEPYREVRWAQLLRIQVASGRARDALQTFQHARNRLIEDLGLEPGDELRALELSVLTRGLASMGSSADAFDDDLDEIPSSRGCLIGRQELLERVETMLGGGMPLVMLGAPGAGKTRFAIEIARGAVANGREARWVDLRNAQFDDSRLEDRFMRWVRRHPGGFVVLDNAEEVVEHVGRVLGLVRRVAPTVDVIVTSRVPVPSDSAVAVVVDPLSLPASDDPCEIEAAPSVRLLRSMLATLAPHVEVEPGVAATICRRMGGLPLGIKLAADLARVVPLADVAGRGDVSFALPIHVATRAVIDQLAIADQHAFASLSVVVGPLDVSLIAALTGRVEGVHDLVRRLVEHGLLQYEPTRSDSPYSVLEPLRAAAAEMLSEPARRTALDRLAQHCLDCAAAVAFPMTTTRNGGRLRVALSRELTWHRQAIAHLSDTGDDRRALELVAALELGLYGLGWWGANSELQDAALAIAGPPSSVRARVHAARGRPGFLHQFDEGHLDAAIEMADYIGDMATGAKARNHLGLRRWWQGRWPEALDLLDRGRLMAEECGDRFLALESQRFTGVVLVSAGEDERGFETQLRVLQRAEQIQGMELLVPHIRMYIGHCRRHVGDDAPAIADLEQSRAEYEALGNRASLIHVYAGLAELHADHGLHELALSHAARALELSASARITIYQPWLFCTIARVQAANGDGVRARAAADSAASALRMSWIGETHRVAVELASVCHVLGDFQTTARLLGIADASEDRRELPFRSRAEAARLGSARSASKRKLGAAFHGVHGRGAISTVSEALAQVTVESS